MNDELKIKNNELGGKMNYRYRTDDEMKDSGIEWIGKIPKEWSIKPVKYLANKNQYYPIGDGDHGSIKPEMYQDEGVPYIRVQNLSWGNELNFEGMVYISEKVNNDNKKSILRPKDILIAKTGATVGKTAIIPQNMLEANTTSSVGKVTVDHSKVDYKYVAYYFQSLPFLTQINMTAYQKSAQPGFNIDDLIDYKVSLPWEIRKQREISDFLDEKTAQFDSIISKKEALIEKLEEAKKSLISEVVTGKVRVVKTNDGYELVERKKEEMKDSGVEWLEDIPKEWDVKRLRFLGSLQNGISKSSDEFGFGYPFVSYGDVYKNIELPKEVKGLVNSSIQDRKIYSVEEGDVLFTRTSETVEEIGFASTCLEEIKDATFAGFLIRFRPNSNRLFKGFSKYYFRCDLNRKFFVKEMNLVTRASLSQNLLNNLSVLLPSYEEQKEIYLALELNVNSINDGISKIRYQIEKLKEAKQSLISEAVTGKIEILD